MAEALGRLIFKIKQDGLWKGVKVAAGVDNISYLQFTDDTLLLAEASSKEARVMNEVLDRCSQIYGQCINWRNLEIFFFNTCPQKQREICSIIS